VRLFKKWPPGTVMMGPDSGFCLDGCEIIAKTDNKEKRIEKLVQTWKKPHQSLDINSEKA
jgi:hypothetical protein